MAEETAGGDKPRPYETRRNSKETVGAGFILARYFLLAIILALVLPVPAWAGEQWSPVAGHSFKKKSVEGYCNCIFASAPIAKDLEGKVQLRDSFTGPEPVYARCYFPGRIDHIPAEDFWHEIWIDGAPAQRTVFEEPPAPGSEETQIWITEDEYAANMEALDKGKHEVVVRVMVNVRQGPENQAEEDKVILTTVKLSQGEFTYIVP